MNLADKVLTFIGYCQKEMGFKFSYKKMAEAFEKVDKKRYSLATLRKELSNLKREGFITLGRRYRKKFPLLTRKGKLEIIPRLPYKKFGHWDGRWRLVLFHIPQEERKYRLFLQKKLSELGFQTMQPGVCISPHPLLYTIGRIATDLGIRQYLTLLETERIDREKWEIQKIWKLNKIDEAYKNFVKKVTSDKINSQKNQPFWPLLAKELEEEFKKIYQKDPHLPSELLPKDWQGKTAYELYKEIINSY